MQAGRLRHRVTIQQLVAGSPPQTETGEPNEVWADVATVWGSVDPLNGRELFAAQEHDSEVTVRIRIRYRSDVTHLMRVSFDSKLYDIRAVIDPQSIHRELQLLCTEGLNNG